MEPKKFFEIDGEYYVLTKSILEEKTSLTRLSTKEFKEKYNKENDEIIPVKLPEKREPKEKPKNTNADGIPDFENEQEYLDFIYNEPDLKMRVKAKNIFQEKFMKP